MMLAAEESTAVYLCIYVSYTQDSRVVDKYVSYSGMYLSNVIWCKFVMKAFQFMNVKVSMLCF